MDKQLIAERFARARATYSREARVQQQVAKRMITCLQNTLADFSPKRIAEFGCGTGLYSRLLWETWHPTLLYLNDLCPEMAFCLEELTSQIGVTFISGDAETCPMPDALHLLTSCSTLQWFANPAKFFQRAHTFIKQGGILAFSTFGKRNLHEIRTLTGKGLSYPLPSELNQWLINANFRLILLEEEENILRFPTPTDVLHHLRMTGVTGTTTHVWSRGRLTNFITQYTKYFCLPQGGVTLTYHPVYVIAEAL